MRSGDLELEFMVSTRSTEGIRVHQKLQRERPDNYVPEVAVSHRVETDRFILDIGGRIDGVYRDPEDPESGRAILEEIKSTSRDLKAIGETGNPVPSIGDRSSPMPISTLWGRDWTR